MPKNLSDLIGRFARLSKGHLPIGVSVIALIVSVASLYVTQLRDAKIEVHASPFLYALDRGGNMEIRLSVTFTNSGARTGVVRNVVLDVRGANEPSQLLQLAYFGGLKEDTNVSTVALPAAIAIEGRSSQTANMVFISPRDKPDVRVFRQEGRYDVSLLVWDSPRNEPTLAERFGVSVDSQHLDTMEQQRTGCIARDKKKRDETCRFIELVNDVWRDWIAGPRR